MHTIFAQGTCTYVPELRENTHYVHSVNALYIYTNTYTVEGINFTELQFRLISKENNYPENNTTKHPICSKVTNHSHPSAFQVKLQYAFVGYQFAL